MATGHLSADELADLIDCKPNQRCRMVAWLKRNNWTFEVGSSGLPRVARAYYERKMGITEGKQRVKHAEAPNLGAFGGS